MCSAGTWCEFFNCWQWRIKKENIPSNEKCDSFFKWLTIAQVIFFAVLRKFMVKGLSSERCCVQIFKEGRANLHDEKRSRRLSLITGHLTRCDITADWRIKPNEISKKFSKTSRSLLYEIVADHLNNRKKCSRWLPQLPTGEHKTYLISSALLHCSSAWPCLKELLKEFRWENFNHPPNSPDLFPCSNHFLPKIKPGQCF